MRLPTSGTVVVVSYRLGAADGVSVEAAKWSDAWRELGFEVRTVAGEGRADRLVPALAAGAGDEAERLGPALVTEVAEAVAGGDLVVVENLCSLPLNPAAGRAVALALRGRPAVLRHHDLAWQRAHLAHLAGPPDDPAWRHVCINERSQRELAARAIPATTLYNAFDPDPDPGERSSVRAALGVGDSDLLVLQPTRAIARKNVAGGLVVAAALGATYWLLGPAEDGYDEVLASLLAAARVRVHHGEALAGASVADAYAACDVVALPSTWEGFGNPALESATHRRPLVVGTYPVATELRRFGFTWFDLGELAPLKAWLAHRDPGLLDRNQEVARRRFCLADLPQRLSEVLASDR